MVIGAVFVFAGVMHFVNPDLYLEMMPDWIPLHGPAVFWSGVAEVAGGLALFFDRTARIGGIWLILVLIAVYPANVQMAIDPDSVPWAARNEIPDWLLWLRLPLQPLLALAIWLVTRNAGEQSPAQRGASSPSSPSSPS
jgi:uncharacterized membrane protein